MAGPFGREPVKKDRDPSVLYCDDASLAQQQFKEESDINVIVNRATQAGALPPADGRPGVYGDFSDVPDYRKAFEVVKRAELLFMDLPWQVRERFSNDPQRMVQFLQNPDNRDEAIKLGLVAAPPPAVPVPPKASSDTSADKPGKADSK